MSGIASETSGLSIAPEVPSPGQVRERIARGERELKVLRRLYRLAQRASAERAEHARYYGGVPDRTDPDGRAA